MDDKGTKQHLSYDKASQDFVSISNDFLSKGRRLIDIENRPEFHSENWGNNHGIEEFSERS